MPAIRRPRVDVILRVPKYLPYSEEAAAAAAAPPAPPPPPLPPQTQPQSPQPATAGAGGSRSRHPEPQTGQTTILVGRPLDWGTNTASSSTLISVSSGKFADGGHSSTPQVTISGPGSGPDADQGQEPSAARTNAGTHASGSGSGTADAEQVVVTIPQPRAKASETSSAEWNSLLTWARKARGPQWDSGLGMWMVDRDSVEYTTFCSDPTQSIFGPSPDQQAENQEGADAAELTRSEGEEKGRTRNNAAAPHRSPSQSQATPSRFLAPSPLQNKRGGLSVGANGTDGAAISGSLPPPHFNPGGGGFTTASVSSGSVLACATAGGGQTRHTAGLTLGGRNW